MTSLAVGSCGASKVLYLQSWRPNNSPLLEGLFLPEDLGRNSTRLVSCPGNPAGDLWHLSGRGLKGDRPRACLTCV